MTDQAGSTRFQFRHWLAPILVGVCWWSGCASRRQFEALEAELRRHEDAMRVTESKAVKLESELTLARRETEMLRSQLAATSSGSPLPEQTGHLVRLSGVKLNTLLSGGKDRDGQPGDDVLVALLSPHDQQGDLVKIAGEVEIEAYDMSRSGDDKRVGRWTFDPDQSSRSWHSGFVGAGLQFELPWQQVPSSRELVVHARLRTTDGRQFDTHAPLKVNPPNLETPGQRPVLPIQSAKYETERLSDPPARHADFHEAQVAPIPSRPVPDYDDEEMSPAVPRPFPGQATPRKLIPPGGEIGNPAGRATLDGVETSDNWTDETLPRLR